MTEDRRETGRPARQSHTPVRRRFTISRLPIFLTLLLAGLKFGRISVFGDIPWEFALSPWWIPLCLLAIENHPESPSKRKLVFLTKISALVCSLSILLRLIGVPFFEIDWWVLLTPFWTVSGMSQLHAWGMEDDRAELRLTGRFWLILILIVGLKWSNIGIFASWSWFWLFIVFASLWGILSLWNVVRMGGERYLLPAYVLLLLTLVLVLGHKPLMHSESNVQLALIFTPILFYGSFCGLVIRPRLRDLGLRLEARNTHIRRQLNSGEPPVPISFDRPLVALPTPGDDVRFRILTCICLLIATAMLHAFGGGFFTLILLQAIQWAKRINDVAGYLTFVLGLSLGRVGMVAVCFASRWLASRLRCGNRFTLWIASSAAALCFLTGAVGVWSPFWDLPVMIILKELASNWFSIAVCCVVVGYVGFAQAGVFGLVRAAQKTDQSNAKLSDTSEASASR